MDRQASAVLLVDPDRRVRTALRTLLTAAGFIISGEAADRPTARAAAGRWAPEFAVVDPLLPTAASGCSLIDELRAELGTVVIALTSDPRLLEPALSAGASRALTKDCAAEELLAALSHAPEHRGDVQIVPALDRPVTADRNDHLCHQPEEAPAVQAQTETRSPTIARNGPAVPSAPLDTIPARVAAAARTHPDRPCLIEGTGSASAGMSFSEVWRAVEAAAERLRRCGIGPDDKVAVLSPNDPRVVVATLALLSLGAAWLPVNSRESTATISTLLDQFGCDAVVVHPDLADVADAVTSEVATVRGALLLDSLSEAPDVVAAFPPRRPGADPNDRDLAAIFPTGGTTGRPKGVAFTHQRLAALAECYATVQARPDDVYLAAAPLTHVGGRICLSVIASGGTVVVLPEFDERAVLEAIQRHRITTLTVTSTMLYRLLDCPDRAKFDTSSLRSLVYGGGPTAVSRIRQAIDAFGPVLEGGYGQTEAPMFITRFRPDDHMRDGEPASDERLRSVGRPTVVSEVRVVDEHGVEVPAGTTGRIVVGGPFTMSGYYRDPDATTARRVGEYHSTGDLGFLDPDGFLTLVGRETELIITGGFNVYPAEVENMLAAQPGVRECAVFGLPDGRWGETVVAVVSAEADATLDPDELRRSVRPLLGGVKTPKRIDVVDELPRNDTGKILKRVLADERLSS